METHGTKARSLPIERFGWITKEEPLSCLAKQDLKIDNCILEAVNPFSGYYGDEPQKEKPRYLYWVIDGRHHYTLEFLTRTLMAIRDKFNPQMQVATGIITMDGISCPVIRMIDMGPYDQIYAMKYMLENAGIKLKKNKIIPSNKMGVIFLNKYLHLYDMGDGIFLDHDNKHRGFFKISRFIHWEEFKIITREVKYDTSLMFFDSARAAYMEEGKVIELVRVYRENLKMEMLQAIKERYLKIIYKDYAFV